MVQITPQMVKELREKTGAGMGDCKQALVDADGDKQAAIEILRKKGAASAAKRADRSAKEGLIAARTSHHGKIASIVEINCETDFVARNTEFVKYTARVANAILAHDVKDLEQLMALTIDGDTIQGLHNEILAKFSEKIEVRRFERLVTNGYIAEYVHAGSKLGVLIEASVADPSEKSKMLIRDIAMQIAAMNPQFIDRSYVTEQQLQKELEIYRELAVNEGKKPEIAERIAQGRLEKFYQEQCLVEQIFVKDSTKTIKDVVREVAEDMHTDVRILSFRRYFLGEE